MALKCYPLQPGGLLAIEVILMGLTNPEHVYHEVDANLEVILLLVFMVAGIYFMKDLLMFVFGRIFVRVKSKIQLSLIFMFMAALLSAFLDALTVTAVLISVFVGFYGIYHKVLSSDTDFDESGTLDRKELGGETLENFRSFLRSLMMHALVGTALGGVCTIVGEPQNLLIGEKVGWNFVEFFVNMAPVTLPVFVFGIITNVILERFKLLGYGQQLPSQARTIIEGFVTTEDRERTADQKYALRVQGLTAVLLVISLAFHLAPVGLIGLMVIVIQTAFIGITDEHKLGKAFEEALPFTALLVVFFAIVAMIHDQHLFTPIIQGVLGLEPSLQAPVFFTANGVLSMISDNVFVATVYINEIKAAFDAGSISREQFEILAVAVNTGTNLPSIATPNGQAAFLFFLTSSLAPTIQLSYGRMVLMALPYTIVLSVVALGSLILFI